MDHAVLDLQLKTEDLCKGLLNIKDVEGKACGRQLQKPRGKTTESGRVFQSHMDDQWEGGQAQVSYTRLESEKMLD